MLIAWTHWAGARLGLLDSFFCEVSWSSGAFSGDDDPAVEQKVFSQLVVGHSRELLTTIVAQLSLLVFPKQAST